MFPVGDGLVPSFLFPPSKIHPGSLHPTTSCPSPLSFLPICLLSAHFCLFSRPPPVSIHHIVRPPSSVRRKATNPPAIGLPMSSPLPPHPHPRQVPPAAQFGGGYKPAYGTLGKENRRRHWSAEAGGLVAFLRTDDGGNRDWRG